MGCNFYIVQNFSFFGRAPAYSSATKIFFDESNSVANYSYHSTDKLLISISMMLFLSFNRRSD